MKTKAMIELAANCIARHFHGKLKCLKAPIKVSAPVKVFSQFTCFGLLVLSLKYLFSQTRSRTCYRFENKYSRDFVAYDRNNNVTNSSPLKKPAFTLAEVLITLGIIGIVAAMTLPSLVGNWKDKQFKTAYKKAYSDLSQVLQEGILEQKIIRTTKFSTQATTMEFDLIKSKFKIIVDCPIPTDISKCWKQGDTVCGGSCSSGNPSDGIDLNSGFPSSGGSSCFVDASGRNWCSYSNSENIFLVDTNGFSQPNRFGKDRWVFTFADANNNRASNDMNYEKVMPFYTDMLNQHSFCKYPPCYYESWLLN